MLSDQLRYLPFLKGIYSTAPGLLVMDKAERPADRLVFQIDNQYEKYIANKVACRAENIAKYYCEAELPMRTAVAINKYLVDKLLTEHPKVFAYQEENDSFLLTNHIKNETLSWTSDWLAVNGEYYNSLFDALCCQVQEDLAVCQLDENNDWLATLHLCAPNHWAAGDKIGKRFDFVHAEVPGMEKTMPHYPSMLQSIVNKGPFTRFAWGIATDDRLNHHPFAPPDVDTEIWKGRNLDAESVDLFVRVERQNLIGFPELNAFLFTIRTYFYRIDSLASDEKALLMSAVNSMSESALRYKGLEGKLEVLKKHLS